MIEFLAQDFYLLSKDNDICYTGPAPMNSTEPDGSDWIGELLILDGRVRKIKAVETGLLLRPIQKHDKIGIVFERIVRES